MEQLSMNEMVLFKEIVSNRMSIFKKAQKALD